MQGPDSGWGDPQKWGNGQNLGKDGKTRAFLGKQGESAKVGVPDPKTGGRFEWAAQWGGENGQILSAILRRGKKRQGAGPGEKKR
jgi:hypothetical protein